MIESMDLLVKQKTNVQKNKIWQQRYLIIQLVSHELRARYYTSFLGFLWVLLVPLSTLVIYTFVFSIVLPSAWQTSSSTPYAFILFAALIPFTLFSEVINRSPTIILGYPNYVKKVVFPLYILPIVVLGSAVVDSLVSIVLLLIGILIFSHSLPVTILLLPLAYLPLLLITLGISWFLASLGVYIRDIGPAVNIFTRLWFFLTPIVYPLERIPQKYLWIMKLNPLSLIVESYRSILLWGEPLNWIQWLIWVLTGTFIAILGYTWFNKTRTGFADVL
jgi:lipopolysaccharide transport system permease protein